MKTQNKFCISSYFRCCGASPFSWQQLVFKPSTAGVVGGAAAAASHSAFYESATAARPVPQKGGASADSGAIRKQHLGLIICPCKRLHRDCCFSSDFCEKGSPAAASFSLKMREVSWRKRVPQQHASAPPAACQRNPPHSFPCLIFIMLLLLLFFLLVPLQSRRHQSQAREMVKQQQQQDVSTSREGSSSPLCRNFFYLRLRCTSLFQSGFLILALTLLSHSSHNHTVAAVHVASVNSAASAAALVGMFPALSADASSATEPAASVTNSPAPAAAFKPTMAPTPATSIVAWSAASIPPHAVDAAQKISKDMTYNEQEHLPFRVAHAAQIMREAFQKGEKPSAAVAAVNHSQAASSSTSGTAGAAAAKQGSSDQLDKKSAALQQLPSVQPEHSASEDAVSLINSKHLCQRIREEKATYPKLSAASGSVEWMESNQKRVFFYVLPLAETTLPGFDSQLLQKSSPSKRRVEEFELTFVVTPTRLAHEPHVQVLYDPLPSSAAATASADCVWLRDTAASGGVLVRFSVKELKQLQQKGTTELIFFVVCKVPCTPHISLQWDEHAIANERAIALKCTEEEGGTVGCPTIKGEAFIGLPLHIKFECEENCLKAIRDVSTPDLQVIARPTNQSRSSSSNRNEVQLLAAWNCVPESPLVAVNVSPVENPLNTQREQERQKQLDATTAEGRAGLTGAGMHCPSVIVGLSAAGVTYLSASLARFIGGQQQPNQQEPAVLHVLVITPLVEHLLVEVSLQLPLSYAELLLDEHQHFLLPAGAFRFFRFSVAADAWSLDKSCATNSLGSRVTYAPVEIAVSSLAGGLPVFAVSNEQLEKRPDPFKRRRDQPYTWRSETRAGDNGPISIAFLGSEVRRGKAPYGSFVVGIRSDEVWSLSEIIATLKGASLSVHAWPQLPVGATVPVNFIPFSRYCKDEFLFFRTDSLLPAADPDSATTTVTTAVAKTTRKNSASFLVETAASTGAPQKDVVVINTGSEATAQSPAEPASSDSNNNSSSSKTDAAPADELGTIALFVQRQRGVMPDELCVVPCGPVDSLFHACPAMPLEKDAPCPTDIVYTPRHEAQIIRFPLPAHKLLRHYYYGVRVRLSSWDEYALLMSLRLSTAASFRVQTARIHNGIQFRGIILNDPFNAPFLDLLYSLDVDALTPLASPDDHYVFSLSFFAASTRYAVEIIPPGKSSSTDLYALSKGLLTSFYVKKGEKQGKEDAAPATTAFSALPVVLKPQLFGELLLSHIVTFAAADLQRPSATATAEAVAATATATTAVAAARAPAEGTWTIRVSAQQRMPLHFDLTVTVAPENGAVTTAASAAAAANSPSALAALLPNAVHLMNGSVYAGRLSTNRANATSRNYFIFTTDFTSAEPQSNAKQHVTCVLASHGRGPKARLFANVMRYNSGGSKSSSSTGSTASRVTYLPPNPDDSDTIMWPKLRPKDTGGEWENLHMFEDEQQLNTKSSNSRETFHSAYVILVEPVPEEAAAAGSAGTEKKSTASPTTSQWSTYTLVCSSMGQVTPLVPAVPVERTIRAESAHFYTFATPLHDEDIYITLTTGVVGDADLYVSTTPISSEKDVNIFDSTKGWGSGAIYISARSWLSRLYCNAAVVREKGCCLYFLMVKAQEDSQYTLEVRQEQTSLVALLAEQPIKTFVLRGQVKTFVYADLSPEDDLRITVHAEQDVQMYAALGNMTILLSSTPLQQGAAQWWADGVARRSIEIKGADIQRRQMALMCAVDQNNSKQQQQLQSDPLKLEAEQLPIKQKQEQQQQQKKQKRQQEQRKNTQQVQTLAGGEQTLLDLESVSDDRVTGCVLRIDVVAQQSQFFTIDLQRAPTHTIITTVLLDSTPNVGVLHGDGDVKYELQLQESIVERDKDAQLHIAVVAFDCEPTLSVRWPDGYVEAFSWPYSKELTIGRDLHPWTPGVFYLMLHDPNERSSCWFIFSAHVLTTMEEKKRVFTLEYNLPLKASVRNGYPAHFVWTAPHFSEDEALWQRGLYLRKKDPARLFLLKVTPLVHEVEAYVQPIFAGKSFPQRPGKDAKRMSLFTRRLEPETVDSSTLVMRIGSGWKDLVLDDQWVPACEPVNLSESNKSDLKDGHRYNEHEEVAFHHLDACQLLISVFYPDDNPELQVELREVEFCIQVTSVDEDALQFTSFGENVRLSTSEFTGRNSTKALLLNCDNPSGDIHLAARCEDPYVVEKITAAFFHDVERLQRELANPYGCESLDQGKYCWSANTQRTKQGPGSAELLIRAEERFPLESDFLFVFIYLNSTYAPRYQPIIEFTATQSTRYTTLRNNIMSDIHSVTSASPTYFTMEVTQSGGQLIVTLDPELETDSASDTNKEGKDYAEVYRKTIGFTLPKISLYVQSCNKETFSRGSWSDRLLPSSMLHTHSGYVNERDQIVTIVENGWKELESPLCYYRIGVYSKSKEPFYFRLTAALLQRFEPLVIPPGLAVLAHISKRPQISRRFGVRQVMAVDHKVTFKFGKSPLEDLVALKLEVCSGAAALRWSFRPGAFEREEANVPSFTLGTLRDISRETDTDTAIRQGRLYRVTSAKEALFLEVSTNINGAVGFLSGNSATFLVQMTWLSNTLCLGAETEDVEVEVARVPLFAQLLNLFSGNSWVLNIQWHPLYSYPANQALTVNKEWACTRETLHSAGTVVPDHLVQYEVFVAPVNATRCNWLTSCGMYMEKEFQAIGDKFVVPIDQTFLAIPVKLQEKKRYRVGVVAKYLSPESNLRIQPFAYRFVEVDLSPRGSQFVRGFRLLLFVLLVMLLIIIFQKRARTPTNTTWGGNLLRMLRQSVGGICNRLSGENIEMSHPCRVAYTPPPITVGCAAVFTNERVNSEGSEIPERILISPLPPRLEVWDSSGKQ